MEKLELINQKGPEESGESQSAVQAPPEPKKEINESGDQLAQSWVKRIEEGAKLSASEQEKILALCETVDDLGAEIRTDFLFALHNNPGKVPNEIAYEAIIHLGSINPESVFEMEEAIINGKDIGKAIKSIKTLQYLTYQNDYESLGVEPEDISREIRLAWEDYLEAKKNNFERDGFYEMREEGDNRSAAMMAARIVLEDVGKKSDNFFIRAEIEQELEYSDVVEKETERLCGEYDDPELRKNYNIPSVFAEMTENLNPEYVKRETEQYVYSRLNDRYGVIYNPDDFAVDSFFALGPKNGSEAPKRLDIEDILEIEGFKKDDIGEEEYKKIALTYKALVELPLRDRVEKKLKIELRDYSVREQVQFVNFLSSKSVDEVEEVKKFLSQAQSDEDRKNRVKSFLSIEAGKDMGDKIFAIGESLDQKTADAIFAKYAEIVDMTGKIREELEGMFKESKEFSQEDLELISRDLIGRANKLLVDFSNKIKITKNKGDIMAKLENYELDLVLTASVYKSLKQAGVEIKLKDFKEVVFEGKTADKIDSEELRQMLKIYGDNYGDKYGYSDNFKKVLVDNLDKKIKNSGDRVKVYMCKKKCENGGDRIMVFNAFEDRGNGKKHGFAYNAIESMSGSSIGKCFLRTSLEMITADGETVEAECDPRSPMSSYYIENEGFVGKGATDNYQNTGEPALNIEKSADNQKFEYRKYAREEIIAEQGNYVEGAKKMVLKFQIETPHLLNNFLREANEIMNEGYTMTRYIFDGQKGPVYCAFEKP